MTFLHPVRTGGTARLLVWYCPNCHAQHFWDQGSDDLYPVCPHCNTQVEVRLSHQRKAKQFRPLFSFPHNVPELNRYAPTKKQAVE